MKVRLAAFGCLLLAGSCANPGLGYSDSRPAWACTSRTAANGIDVTATRTLDARGRQLQVDYQWSIGGFDRGRLALMAIQNSKTAGEPPVFPRELLVSWSGFPDRLQRERPMIVLHPVNEPPNTLDGAAMIPYANNLIGAVLSWQRAASLARYSPSAQLSLLDPRGHAIRFAAVDLTRLSEAVQRTSAALDDTRAQAENYEKKCETAAEWMRL